MEEKIRSGRSSGPTSNLLVREENIPVRSHCQNKGHWGNRAQQTPRSTAQRSKAQRGAHCLKNLNASSACAFL